MLKDLFVYVKYPAVAGIIGTIWIGTMLFILIDRDLPVGKMLLANLAVTLILAIIGFRVDKA